MDHSSAAKLRKQTLIITPDLQQTSQNLLLPTKKKLN
jgi:hypothetical protein